jgi:DnaJ family protein C protein 7
VNELISQPPSSVSSGSLSEEASTTPPTSDVSSEQQEEEEDTTKKAEGIKEEGNVAFKAKKYAEAIDLYSKAIGASSRRFLHRICIVLTMC